MVGVSQRAKARLLLAVNDRGYVIGEQHHRARLTDHDIDLILALRAEGMSQRVVAEKMECSRRTVRDVETGRIRSQTASAWRAPRNGADKRGAAR